MTIEGRGLEREAGRTVLDVAQGNGIDFPAMSCRAKTSAAGGWRACPVETEGVPGLGQRRAFPAGNRMVIKTENPRVVDRMRTFGYRRKRMRFVCDDIVQMGESCFV